MDEDATEVRLTLPPGGEHVQLARLVAAGLASRLDFDYEEIEDLRLAVDELCFALLSAGAPSGPLDLRYRVEGGDLRIEGSLAVAGGAHVADPPELTARILETVVDEYSLADGDGTATFRLSKRRASPV